MMMMMLMNELDIEKTSWKLDLNHMINFLWVKKIKILEIMIAAGSIFEKMVNIINNFLQLKKVAMRYN